MIGYNPLGASVYTSAKTAIVRKEEKNCEWHQGQCKFAMETLSSNSIELCERLAAWKDSGTWKKKFGTWKEACEIGLGYTQQWVNKLIERVRQGDSAASQPQNEAGNQVDAARKMSQKSNESQETPETPVSGKYKNHANEEESSTGNNPEYSSAEATFAMPPMDASGCVIPQALLALRDRREEVTGLIHHAEALTAFLKRIEAKFDPLFASLLDSHQLQTFATSIRSIRYALAECCPDIVCPDCQGESKKCTTCTGTGWICQVRWNRDWVKSNDSVKQKEVARRQEGNV